MANAVNLAQQQCLELAEQLQHAVGPTKEGRLAITIDAIDALQIAMLLEQYAGRLNRNG